MEKFQITDPPPKVWVSGFLSVDRNGILVLAIMKKLKNGHHFININHMETFQITDPPKVWVSGFLSVDRNGILVLAIMKKLKNCHHFVNINHMEKSQITHPHPEVWVSGFPSVDGNGILKNDHHYLSYRKISNYQPPPPKVWVSGFLSVKGNGISVSAIMKKLKNGRCFISVENWRYEFFVGSFF